MKNECAKMRPVSNPYEVWATADRTWTWKVLKKYQTPEKEALNPYARWFCSVTSPICTEMGDVYVATITGAAVKIA
jgi:hypothetical protein